jgi:short-subunit dehydrogenase
MNETGGHVIIGATSEIARPLALELAMPGSRLVIAGRDAEALEILAGDLHIRSGAHVTPIRLEATDYDSHPAFVERCIETLGAIEGVVICHGYLVPQRVAQTDWAEARRMIEVNFMSVVSLGNLFAEYLASRRQGYLCGVSSVAGDRGRQSNYLYGATKAGFSTYLQGLRNRLFHEGVAVITVKPGFVDTSMIWGRINPKSPLVAAPERVARDIARAIRKRKNVVYTPWYWRFIVAAMRLLPEAIFKRLRL